MSNRSAAAPRDPWIGRLIDGRFWLRDLAATNGMVRTYLAEQADVGRDVSVKLLITDNSSGPEVEAVRARFVREAAALARLSHPSIVRIFDRGEVDGVPYLVSEHIRGVSLQTYLRHHPVSPTLAIDIIDELARALAVAHANGIIHRGLSPDSVHIRRDTLGDLVVQLVDFGVADDLHAMTDTVHPRRVTPWYLAPEQALHAAEDVRTDIYALGILLCRLLVGATPFSHLSGASVLVAHIRTPPPGFDVLRPGHGFPAMLEWTVQACIAKAPDDRFADTLEVRRALQLCRVALLRPDLQIDATLVEGRLEVSDEVAPHLLGSHVLVVG